MKGYFGSKEGKELVDLLLQTNAVQPIINAANVEIGIAVNTHPFIPHTGCRPPSLSSLQNADAAHMYGHGINSKNYALSRTSRARLIQTLIFQMYRQPAGPWSACQMGSSISFSV